MRIVRIEDCGRTDLYCGRTDIYCGWTDIYCGRTDKYDLIVHKYEYEYEYDNNIYIALGQINMI